MAAVVDTADDGLIDVAQRMLGSDGDAVFALEPVCRCVRQASGFEIFDREDDR